jgi:hypothetical protein
VTEPTETKRAETQEASKGWTASIGMRAWLHRGLWPGRQPGFGGQGKRLGIRKRAAPRRPSPTQARHRPRKNKPGLHQRSAFGGGSQPTQPRMRALRSERSAPRASPAALRSCFSVVDCRRRVWRGGGTAKSASEGGVMQQGAPRNGLPHWDWLSRSRQHQQQRAARLASFRAAPPPGPPSS